MCVCLCVVVVMVVVMIVVVVQFTPVLHYTLFTEKCWPCNMLQSVIIWHIWKCKQITSVLSDGSTLVNKGATYKSFWLYVCHSSSNHHTTPKFCFTNGIGKVFNENNLCNFFISGVYFFLLSLCKNNKLFNCICINIFLMYLWINDVAIHL